MTKNTKLVLGFILLLALIIRVFRLTSIPPGLNQDEAVNGYDAYSLETTLRDHHGNFLPIMLQSFDDWTSPLITYITIPFVKNFGLSLFSVRIVAVMLGVGSIFLLYLFLKQITKKQEMALLGAFLLAISPWHITLSRWAIPPSTVTFFLLLFLWSFFWTIEKSQKNKSIWLFIIPGITGGILTYSYPTLKLFGPLFVFFLALIYLRTNLKGAVIFLASLAILISPIYLLTITDGKYNARFAGVSGLTETNAKKEILSRYTDYFLPHFQFQSGDTDAMHQVPGFGNSDIFLSVFFYSGILISVLGLFKVIKIPNIGVKTYLMLLTWLLLFPIAASLTKDRNMVLRVVQGLPLVVIFSIISMTFGLQFIKKTYTSFLIAIVVAISLINFGKFSRYYFTQYPDLVYRQYQYGMKEIMKYLLKNQDKFDKVIIDNNINQPYIYYLFYSSFDPKKLDYKNPKLSDPKYVYETVSREIVAELPCVLEVAYKDTSPRLGICTKDRIWYVKQYY